MWSSISTACKNRSLLLALLAIACSVSAVAQNQALRAPSGAVAGQPASIETTGSGSGKLYLSGPNISRKSDVELGKNVSLSAKDLAAAGRYIVTLCAGTCSSAVFYVAPAKPVALTFIVHPSRVPVAQNNAVSGVALPFDEFKNLVLAPATVVFQLNAKGSGPSRQVQTSDGVAWFRTGSGKSAGPLQVMASIGDVVSRRVVQQVASEPCRLRIKGERTAKGIEVETEPVRDCSGNPVPDGTIVTFTAKNGDESSTVDAPVKQDIARARMTAAGPVVVSAASGVVMGNELRLGQ